jgi:putative addiction module killer protein
MIQVRETHVFSAWLIAFRDRRAVAKINARIDRLQLGNFGDVKHVGDNVSEMRIHFGPGYRVYFTKVGDTIVVLLCAGDKGSQAGDIKLAKSMAAELRGAK